MKLKKFAALALAGVMAVSMLAGCAGKGTTDDGKTEEPTDLSAAVIAALSEDTTKKVSFTVDTKLPAAMAAVEKKYGTNSFGSELDAAELNAVDSTISANGALDDVKSLTLTSATEAEKSIKAAAKESNATYVVGTSTGVQAGYSTEYAVKTIAKKIDTDIKSLSSGAKMPADSGVYAYKDADNNTVNGRITFNYTGTVCVYTQTDAVTGVVTYYLVYTLTRTGVDAKV